MKCPEPTFIFRAERSSVSVRRKRGRRTGGERRRRSRERKGEDDDKEEKQTCKDKTSGAEEDGNALEV
ncbi:hypothetical protein ALC62_09831 [Cyphomyrmex costatus]|uniref:Uncharacterized protein n=1 Tax=Cyphomyrmex costatus TaxID=456900 RepID=A0A195CF26_9HYME|nr:hypothetical protein ALC62_09831 [Cyphomyrmex costatus]